MDDTIQNISGWIFDIYHFEDIMYLWIIDQNRNTLLIKDFFYPTIYITGEKKITQKFIARLIELNVLAASPRFVSKIHFYQNKPIQAIELSIKKTSFLRTIYKKLYHFFDKIDIYHSDIEIPSYYMMKKNIFPLAKVKILAAKGILQSIESIDNITDFEYSLPPIKILNLQLKYPHRIPIKDNPINMIVSNNKSWEIYLKYQKNTIEKINSILEHVNPDVILSSYGDQIILPAIFDISQKLKIKVNLDRETIPINRKIITRGSSFFTYGNMIYKAPSYPLFGRWHIDSVNSFVFKESQLLGIIDLARISRLSVQKLARASTGTALTYMEMDNAIKLNYLIPWQKSSVEQEKTAYHLLQIDKGGLVFEPNIKKYIVYENVLQMDFAQMYPTIMANHNLSPETVLCPCCAENINTNKVPEAGYHICTLRQGIVSLTIRAVLGRRKFFKSQIANPSLSALEIEHFTAKQKALKWLLVTSFGYLGYRNAKFGRLESHEAVTAFGREKLLTAKEIAEENGFRLLNAITDSLFIQKKTNQKSKPTVKEELNTISKLQHKIFKKTGIEINHEGTYAWLVFLPSKKDGLTPVANRYFGLFKHGELKIRGIFARRKDIAPFIREAQSAFLNIMRQYPNIQTLKSAHALLYEKFNDYKNKLLNHNIHWTNLLIRTTVSHELNDYRVQNATFKCLQQLKNNNLYVQPGEKIRYLIVSKKKNYYLSEEIIYLNHQGLLTDYDTDAYVDLLWEAFHEVWAPFAPYNFFKHARDKQLYLFSDL